MFVLLGSVFTATALGSQPKFHFRDCVRVNKGFYSGCAGRVAGFLADTEEEYCADQANKHVVVETYKYDVDGFCNGGFFSANLSESDISLTKAKCNN